MNKKGWARMLAILLVALGLGYLAYGPRRFFKFTLKGCVWLFLAPFILLLVAAIFVKGCALMLGQ